jgi:hypothetical protein
MAQIRHGSQLTGVHGGAAVLHAGVLAVSGRGGAIQAAQELREDKANLALTRRRKEEDGSKPAARLAKRPRRCPCRRWRRKVKFAPLPWQRPLLARAYGRGGHSRVKARRIGGGRRDGRTVALLPTV